MNHQLRPENRTPILKCQGVADCGWKPHEFVVAASAMGGLKLMFACGGCKHERLFGFVSTTGGAS